LACGDFENKKPQKTDLFLFFLLGGLPAGSSSKNFPGGGGGRRKGGGMVAENFPCAPWVGGGGKASVIDSTRKGGGGPVQFSHNWNFPNGGRQGCLEGGGGGRGICRGKSRWKGDRRGGASAENYRSGVVSPRNFPEGKLRPVLFPKHRGKLGFFLKGGDFLLSVWVDFFLFAGWPLGAAGGAGHREKYTGTPSFVLPKRKKQPRYGGGFIFFFYGGLKTPLKYPLSGPGKKG